MMGLWKVWFCPKILNTLSTLLSPSKNGMRSSSSVSLGSSNHDVTGTYVNSKKCSILKGATFGAKTRCFSVNVSN